MTLEQLRAFVAVAETPVGHAAAEPLHLAQSAVSAAIAALEARRHAKLFYHVAPLGLTEAGSLFPVEAQDILATGWRGSAGSEPRSSSRIGQKHSSSPMRWREEHAPMPPAAPRAASPHSALLC
jgi:DNA-binding transcriptional LysR family regulator